MTSAAVLDSSAPASTPRLSEEILGLDWSRHLPCPLGEGGAVLRVGSHAEVRAFLSRHREALVAPELEGGRFAQLEEGPRKEIFCERATDSFVVEHQGTAVGVFVGQLQDWSSYYMRYFAMLPRARGFGAVTDLVERFVEILEPHGIERLELDVSVSHLRQLRRLIGCDFYVMGTLQSDRWGAMVHMVRFVSERHESVFLDQFSAGIRSGFRTR